MTVLSDIIRRVDLEAAKYAKLVATLPANIDGTGLAIPESDLLLILFRSLPELVRLYCWHHSAGDSYMAFHETVRRWETQQGLFHETHGSQTHGKNNLHQLTDDSKGGADWHSLDDSHLVDHEVDAVSNDKCSKCGSKKHRIDSCAVDVSKIKCFSCGGCGHIEVNSPEECRGVNEGKWAKGKREGKGKGYGKKSKLNETVDTDPT